jgi:hypothetical protein
MQVAIQAVELEDGALGVKRAKRSWLQRIGFGGLAVSLGIHLLLIIGALFWVILTVSDASKKDPESFATGAGGGSNGDRAKMMQHRVQPKNPKTIAKNVSRITSKNANSSISLPDLPTASSSTLLSGMLAGGASKGFGGGSGGGIGTGMGLGVGGGKNFVGRPVMGARIMAQKIAVYMDASGSMGNYLDRVEAEIRKQFPDADVFMYNGIFTFVQDGSVIGGLRFKGQPIRSSGAGIRDTDPKKLSAMGKAVLKKYDTNFMTGSVGAWIDIMRQEKGYDALVLFSDFEDGVTQWRIKGEKGATGKGGSSFPVVYYDGTRTDVGGGTDVRKPAEKTWEEEWLRSFAAGKDGHGPRLYCFSTEQEPQPLISKCVVASGGQIKMVKWLRDGGEPPPEDANAAAMTPAATAMPGVGAPKAYKPPR